MQEVKFYYGPYRSNGIIRHKPQKLRGVIDYLKKLECDVKLIPIPYFERLVVVIKGRVICSCNMTLLLFNMHCDEDPTCIKLLNAIKEAQDRLYNIKNIKIFSGIKKEKRVLTNLNLAKTTNGQFEIFSNSSMPWCEIPTSSK